MTESTKPELARLREIAELGLAGEVDEPAIQTLVDRAAQELDLPLAAVSIVLDSAQYFIAQHGIGGWIGAAEGTPSEWAFCRHAVERRKPFIVEDSSRDELVRDNPLVKYDGIRCYLGVPLITSKDQALGTLCVLGSRSRQFTEADIARLRTLADDVLGVLEARRGSY
jgi:GAF domain-containing protein